MEELIEEEVKITTINKPVTKAIINEADQKATRIEIYDINDEDSAVTCRLYEGDKLIEHKRVYEISKLPCEVITKVEKEILFPLEIVESELIK